MSNWYGTSRTNWFTPTDLNALTESVANFNFEMHFRPTGEVLLAGNDDGAFPTWAYVEGEEGVEDEEVEFSWEEHVCPFVPEGHVLVVFEAGAEKLRYITGYARAFIRHGDVVDSCGVVLSQIYKLAAETFGIPEEQINPAEY